MYDLFCTDCGDQFQAVRPDKRYCSSTCQARAGRRRRGEQTDATKAGADCQWCGQHFDITPPSTNQRHCSDECSREAARKQRREFYRKNPERRKVYNSRRPYRDVRIARLRRRYDDIPTSCESCGEKRVLEVAHRPEYARKGAGRSVKNSQRHMFWILCPTCHKLLDYEICSQEELRLT
jgi:hypothetical protein